MVAILSEFLIYAILIHTITSANEVFDKEIQNKLGQAEKDEHEHPSLLENIYNKRVNYALMGGLYGKKPPFHGGIYGKRQLFPSRKYYSKHLQSPEIMHNEDFTLPIYYDNHGKFGQLPYKFERKYIEEDDSDQYKDNSYFFQILPKHFKPNQINLKSLQINDEFHENIICTPPSKAMKDSQNAESCKLPPEIFPHKVIYQEFCSVLYFGTMENDADGPFCRLSSIQKKQLTVCDSGWAAFYEGLHQFCYKAFTIDSKSVVDIMSKTDGDPCRKQKNTSSLVRIPNPNVNMFLYVRVLEAEQNLLCNSTDEKTYYYYIGLYRRDFDWRWRPYDETAQSDLKEEAEQLVDYLNQPLSKHTWSDGTQIFADGWDNVNDATTNVVLSNCGMWRDFKTSQTNFTHKGKHVANQGYICAYHS